MKLNSYFNFKKDIFDKINVKKDDCFAFLTFSLDRRNILTDCFKTLKTFVFNFSTQISKKTL